MSKDFQPRHLDVRSFAAEGALVSGNEPVQQHHRLVAETQGRGAASRVTWSARGELRNPRHLYPEIWLHLKAQVVLAMTCQRCLSPVDVPISIERSFRFAADENMAAAQDEQSEEDVLALSPSFDLLELVEDELLMELPLSPRHVSCPVPLKSTAVDHDFDAGAEERDNPFAILEKFKPAKPR